VSEPYAPLDAAYAAARWGWYLAAFLILGAGSYAPFLIRIRTGVDATHPELATDLARRAARIGAGAATALLLLTTLRLYLQTRTLLDPGEPVSADLLRATLATRWGHGWTRQALMALLAGLAFLPASRGSRPGWMVAAAASGGLGLTAGMTGHSVTERAGAGGFLLDAAHIWAGGLWLGSLAVLLIAGFGACRGVEAGERPLLLRALVADFSRRALLFGPLAMGLGVWLAVRYLGWGWPLHLTGSGYGIALAVKLAALAAVAAMGVWNWRVVRPALARPGGEARLRRSARLELMFGALLLAATAVLVALPFPGEEM
jgi:putative copper export protein